MSSKAGALAGTTARAKEEATVMLDEWDDAEGAEISQIRNFMVDFRLNDEGELDDRRSDGTRGRAYHRR